MAAIYKVLGQHHPDRDGSHEMSAKINSARDVLLAQPDQPEQQTPQQRQQQAAADWRRQQQWVPTPEQRQQYDYGPEQQDQPEQQTPQQRQKQAAEEWYRSRQQADMRNQPFPDE